MRATLPMLAALALLGACATAPAPLIPPPPPEAAVPTALYGPQIQQKAAALIAAEPKGVVPEGLRLDILAVEEIPAGLVYTAQLSVPGRRKADRDYIIYGRCPADDLGDCAKQIASGARMLVK